MMSSEVIASIEAAPISSARPKCPSSRYANAMTKPLDPMREMMNENSSARSSFSSSISSGGVGRKRTRSRRYLDVRGSFTVPLIESFDDIWSLGCISGGGCPSSARELNKPRRPSISC
ncbi:MAG: hypothetical protein ACI8S6_000940 [Myxococcota bacterium]|jgi:hypothetical protein